MKVLKQNKFWLAHYHDEKYEKIRKLIQSSFCDLIFEEEPHKYYLNGEELDCVSNITHLFKPHFETDSMAVATFNRNYNNPDSKYFGMTVEEIKNAWKKISDDACSTGTSRHNFGESVFWWEVGEYENVVSEFKDRFTEDEEGNKIVTAKFPKEEAILDFWNDLPDCYIPILAENKVFNVNETYKYSGTFDILFYYDATLNNKKDELSGLLISDYKGLPLGTNILTTNGWKTIGTVTKNDIIFDGNGKRTKILNISNIHNNPCYKIKFDNGYEIVADEEHRWEITITKESTVGVKEDKNCVLTTKELFNIYNWYKKSYSERYKFKISVTPFLEESETKLTVDPYVLGVWLTCGYDSCGVINCDSDLICDEIKRRGYLVYEDVVKGAVVKTNSRIINGLMQELKRAKLIYNKQIPTEYLIGNRSARFGVLHGIMDTIGQYDDNEDKYYLVSMKKDMVDNYVMLLSSIGIKCFVKKNKYSYCVSFRSKFSPFLTKSVVVNSKKYDEEENNFYFINSIEKCETVETKCLEVESPLHTYIFGEHFIKTHNTNKDLYKNFKEQKLLSPFNEMLDNSLNIYKLQLAAYQLCLEKIGLKIIGRRLIWLRPSGVYEKVPLEDMSKRLHYALINEFSKK